MKVLKKRDLTRKELRRWNEFRDEIVRRARAIAEVYFNDHPDSGVSDIWSLEIEDGEFQVHRSLVRVIAKDGSSRYADEVKVPLKMILKSDFLDRAREWVNGERERRDKERANREVASMSVLMRGHPDDARRVMAEMGMISDETECDEEEDYDAVERIPK